MVRPVVQAIFYWKSFAVPINLRKLQNFFTSSDLQYTYGIMSSTKNNNCSSLVWSNSFSSKSLNMQTLKSWFEDGWPVVHGKYMTELVNHTGKSYWWGKIWRKINSQCIYHNTFSVYLWLMVRKILVNGSQFSKFANFPPTKIFRVRYQKQYTVSDLSMTHTKIIQ